ncbi:preprotein translocase, YajC subunit [Enterococcus casseliflavus ATCC 12755]|uniref:Preprotein translocase, YajC subunit n=1 Tax=Enterococcus casseliflavus ATCC 12755 TaxID=888066 RepID=F0EGT4_ENTCA|nr:preprotein translocase subunit YajC [Enterococcus casseliflavus]EGC71004.1 preprotein translocase, YajC subunit [Enterococcus casseliflavus ATCC 12755]
MWEMILAASIVVLVFLFLFLAVSSFLNEKHLKKQKGYFAELQQSLKKGQKIKLYGGIIGEIQTLGKETVDLRVKSGTVIEVERSAVTEIMQ